MKKKSTLDIQNDIYHINVLINSIEKMSDKGDTFNTHFYLNSQMFPFFTNETKFIVELPINIVYDMLFGLKEFYMSKLPEAVYNVIDMPELTTIKNSDIKRCQRKEKIKLLLK